MRNKTILGGALMAAIAAVGVAAPAHAELKTSFKGAPEFSDGDFKFKVRGRMMLDVFNVNRDLEDPDGPAGTLNAGQNDQSYRRSGMRRMRLGVEGQFTKQFKYKVEAELGSNNANTFKSAYVEYVGKKYSLVMGQDKAVAPLEEKTSSRFITFNERAMVHSALDTGPYLAGLYVLGGGPNYSWSFGVSGDDASSSESAGREESYQVLGRATWAPIFVKSPTGLHLLHLGAFVRYRDSAGDAAIQYRARPAALGFDDRTVDTGAVGDNDKTFGVEAAYVFGPFSLQGEWLHANVERRVGGDVAASGAYIDAIWNFTGESRNYKGGAGEFTRNSASAPLESGGPGMWQLAARAEQVDLTDGTLKGGTQSGYTLGLHWYPTSYVGFKLNYGYTDIARDGTANLPLGSRSGEAQVISFRTQIDW
jgi:phosphate-selective porin OprO/OprP